MADTGINRTNPSYRLLCARWIGAFKDCFPRTEDDTTVRFHARISLKVALLMEFFSPVSTFQSYFQRLVKSFRNPSALVQSAPNAAPTNVLQTVRNINRTQVVSGAVIFAELLGFFTVGEMIGRMKLVGYRGDIHGEHH